MIRRDEDLGVAESAGLIIVTAGRQDSGARAYNKWLGLSQDYVRSFGRSGYTGYGKGNPLLT